MFLIFKLKALAFCPFLALFIWKKGQNKIEDKQKVRSKMRHKASVFLSTLSNPHSGSIKVHEEDLALWFVSVFFSVYFKYIFMIDKR